MGTKKVDIYGGKDPREIPAYPLAEAARHLYMSERTLASWTAGRKPLIRIPQGGSQLSFYNLVEAFVLDVLRRQRRFSLQQLRRDVSNLQRHFPNLQHPLADADLLTYGQQLYAEDGSDLANITRAGQLAMPELLRDFLRRVEKDVTGVVRLYPFTRSQKDPAAPKSVVIDPRVSFGRPVIAGTGIPTDVIAERFKAGDSIAAIAKDYGRAAQEIEEAIRYEAAA